MLMSAFVRRAFIVSVLLMRAAIAQTDAPADANDDAYDGARVIRLATTTSTDNSGLLKAILPQFERASGYGVRVIAVGTGKALRLGERGDVDAVLVHAPRSEKMFVANGHGVDRREVMVNDFIIAGPKADPANLRAADSPRDAFIRMRAQNVKFVSRGDDSGTHKKETQLRQRAGITEWPARVEVGQGMGKSLQIADELQAHILIDRATWVFLRAQTSLAVLYAGGDALRNPYGVIAVNSKHRRVNYTGARALIDWLASPRGRDAIGGYRVDGEQLFIPAN